MPADSEDLLGAILAEWPSYLAYLVSFSTIGAVWLEHTVITEFLDRATSALIRANLLLLLVVSFLPFPTRLLSEYAGSEGSERVAVTVYGINLLVVALAVSTLWRFAVRDGLVRADIAADEVRQLTRRFTLDWQATSC